MGRPVVHWEFMSKDPEKVSDFYAKIFGWKVRHIPQLNYRLVETGAKGEMRGINGGILKPEREGPCPATCFSTSSSTTSRPTARRSSTRAA